VRLRGLFQFLDGCCGVDGKVLQRNDAPAYLLEEKCIIQQLPENDAHPCVRWESFRAHNKGKVLVVETGEKFGFRLAFKRGVLGEGGHRRIFPKTVG